MTFTELIYAIGDVLTSSFKVLPLIGNNFNYLVIIVGFIGLAYWLNYQIKKTKQAKQDGTYI